MLLDPVPSVAKAYSIVLRVEKQRNNDIQFSDVIEHSSHLARLNYISGRSATGSKQSKNAYKSDKFGNYCKETGHVKENCFKLIGYLDWWKGRKK